MVIYPRGSLVIDTVQLCGRQGRFYLEQLNKLPWPSNHIFFPTQFCSANVLMLKQIVKLFNSCMCINPVHRDHATQSYKRFKVVDSCPLCISLFFSLSKFFHMRNIDKFHFHFECILFNSFMHKLKKYCFICQRGGK